MFGRATITLGIGAHSSSFFFYLFSLPNLSRRRLNDYHTSTYGVTLARIQDSGLKRAACGSLEIQDAKKSPKIRHLRTIAQLCRALSSQLRHISTVEKKLLNSNISPRCSHNMVNIISLLAAEICWRVWAPCKFQRVSRLGSVTPRQSSSGCQPINFAALNRRRHLYSAGRPSRWALAHISSSIWFSVISSYRRLLFTFLCIHLLLASRFVKVLLKFY